MVTPIQLGPTAFTLTLDGTAQRLSDVLAAVFAAGQDLDMEPQVSQLILQGDGDNGAPVFLGTDATVDSTNHAYAIPAGAAGVPGAALSLGPLGPRQLYLSNLWVKGTDGHTLHFLLIPWTV